MREILEAYPSAQRALFTRYHIGGCSSCGFEPEQTLESVLKGKNVLDVDEAVEHIKNSQAVDDKMEISPEALAALLKKGGVRLLDVRSPGEHAMVHIEGDELITEALVGEIKNSWPKDTLMVFYCHHGVASLNAASYMVGHGFVNAKSLRGGVDAWSKVIDPLMPTY